MRIWEAKLLDARYRKSVEARLERKSVARGACRIWTGVRFVSGYGCIWIGGASGTLYVHRVAYTLAHGRLPPRTRVVRSCDERLCIAPAHLRAVPSYGERTDTARLRDVQVAMIRRSSAKGVDLAVRYGVAQSTISMVRRGLARRA